MSSCGVLWLVGYKAAEAESSKPLLAAANWHKAPEDSVNSQVCAAQKAHFENKSIII